MKGQQFTVRGYRRIQRGRIIPVRWHCRPKPRPYTRR